MLSGAAGSWKSHSRTHTIRSSREPVEPEWEYAMFENVSRICSKTAHGSTFKRIKAVSELASVSFACAMVITELAMTKLRVVIVDDEALARSVLREYLQEHPVDPMLWVSVPMDLEAVKAVAISIRICCSWTFRCPSLTV